jgi:hypothetical protein
VVIALVGLLILLHLSPVHSSSQTKAAQNDSSSSSSSSTTTTTSDKERGAGKGILLPKESVLHQGQDRHHDDAPSTTIKSRNTCVEDNDDNNDMIPTVFEAIVQAPIPFANPVEEAQSQVRTYVDVCSLLCVCFCEWDEPPHHIDTHSLSFSLFFLVVGVWIE